MLISDSSGQPGGDQAQMDMKDETPILRTRRPGASAGKPAQSPGFLHARAVLEIDGDEASFRSLADESSGPLALVEHDTTVRYANAAAASLLGLSSAEIVGKSIFEALRYEDADRAAAFFQEALANPGEPVTTEFLFRRRGGGLRALEVVALNRLDVPG